MPLHQRQRLSADRKGKQDIAQVRAQSGYEYLTHSIILLSYYLIILLSYYLIIFINQIINNLLSY
ncbi:hypothetical protein CHG83_22955 [Salmonella enterica]|nr:hypothetical protein [Salmonella enterica]